MSIKSSQRKALALALAITLQSSYISPVIFAEDTEQTAPSSPTDPAPEGKTPPAETIPEPAENGGDTGDSKTTGKETTVWDPAQSQPCDENTMCDPANVSPANQEWKDILSMMAILFGERSSSDDAGTAGASSVGITGDAGSTTVTAPELPAEFSTINPTGDPDLSFSETPIGPDLSGIQLGLLGGIPLSPNASYTWSRVGPGAISVQALVYPLNPEVDSSTKFGTLVTSTNPSVHIYPPAQYASETYTTGGNYSKTFKFMTMEYAKGHAPRFGSVTVKVNAKVYEGTTALCSSEESCDNGLQAGSEFDSNGNVISNTGNGVTNTGSTSTGGISTNGNLGNNSTLDDLFSGLGNGSNSSGGTGTSSNASSPDWLSDGFSSNNNPDSNGSVPTDFGSQFADNNTTPTDNSSFGTDTTPTPNTANGNAQFSYAGGNSIGTDSSSNPSGTGTTNSSNNNPYGTTSSTDGPLNSLFSKIDSAIGNDPSSSNSLTSKFSSLINTGDKTAKTIAEMSQPKRLPGAVEDSFTAASNAELTDVAKQMLIGYGTSQEDIKAGKLFDAGSAYTDPSDAWNLNRMSTILKSKNLTVK